MPRGHRPMAPQRPARKLRCQRDDVSAGVGHEAANRGQRRRRESRMRSRRSPPARAGRRLPARSLSRAAAGRAPDGSRRNRKRPSSRRRCRIGSACRPESGAHRRHVLDAVDCRVMRPGPSEVVRAACDRLLSVANDSPLASTAPPSPGRPERPRAALIERDELARVQHRA